MVLAERGGVVRMVVVGTGTGIGKTHVSRAVLAAAKRAGHSVVGLKPIESGTDVEPEGDAAHLARTAGTFHVKHALYAFGPPISPHLAARRAGVRIDLAAVRSWVGENNRLATLAVVETPGGLFSPLARGVTNADLVLALAPAYVLLVAPDRLGVLHELTATLGFARAQDVRVDAIALSTPETPDASTGSNASELAALGICEPVSVFPRAQADAPASLAAANLVLARLGVC